MSENWKLQLSVKIDGQHLLNLRADSSGELSGMLTWAVENREALLAATAALEGSRKPEPARPAQTHSPTPVAAPAAPSGEVGPVLVKGVQKSILRKDGTKMKSPRFTVEFSNDKRHSTFDEMVAGAAETLSGESVYYSTDDSEYHNLTSVRRAL